MTTHDDERAEKSEARVRELEASFKTASDIIDEERERAENAEAERDEALERCGIYQRELAKIAVERDGWKLRWEAERNCKHATEAQIEVLREALEKALDEAKK